VHAQRALLRKRPPAVLARVRLLPRVHPLVFDHVALVPEPTVAVATLERLLAGVDLHVIFHALCSFETFATLLETHTRTSSKVNSRNISKTATCLNNASENGYCFFACLFLNRISLFSSTFHFQVEFEVHKWLCNL
jgi:hypothetical protein